MISGEFDGEQGGRGTRIKSIVYDINAVLAESKSLNDLFQEVMKDSYEYKPKTNIVEILTSCFRLCIDFIKRSKFIRENEYIIYCTKCDMAQNNVCYRYLDECHQKCVCQFCENRNYHDKKGLVCLLIHGYFNHVSHVGTCKRGFKQASKIIRIEGGADL